MASKDIETHNGPRRLLYVLATVFWPSGKRGSTCTPAATPLSTETFIATSLFTAFSWEGLLGRFGRMDAQGGRWGCV
jgi:hypothetical protein